MITYQMLKKIRKSMEKFPQEWKVGIYSKRRYGYCATHKDVEVLAYIDPAGNEAVEINKEVADCFWGKWRLRMTMKEMYESRYLETFEKRIEPEDAAEPEVSNVLHIDEYKPGGWRKEG